jgi:hypothetical protein
VWVIDKYSQLVTGRQLEEHIVGLITSADRAHLSRLPVFVMGLGAALKPQPRRNLMWAYSCFRPIVVRMML